MSCIEAIHVDHTIIRRSWEGSETNPSWGRVNITQLHLLIAHSNLKEMKGHVIISRAAHKLVGCGGKDVTDQTISDVMDIRDVARK